MGEILGLGISDFPNIRVPARWMCSPLHRLADRVWAENGKPHLAEISKWPKAMQEEWAGDGGEDHSVRAQAHQIEQFRKVRAALDDFTPDFMVVLFRGGGEAVPNGVYQYHIQAHESLTATMFSLGERGNILGEDPERVDTIPGHREGALHLVRALQDRGLNPLHTADSFTPESLPGRGHFVSVTVHLDWDRREFKTPIVPIGFNPFGFNRTRNDRGLSPWDHTLPRPLLPKEAFELGRAIAQTFKASPWRVALVAGVDWSHQNDSGWELERIHPDVDADRRRYEEVRSNRFDDWGESWSFDEMEEHAQWELLVTLPLMGAMAELGSKVVYSDFAPNYVINDNFVTTIFEPK